MDDKQIIPLNPDEPEKLTEHDNQVRPRIGVKLTKFQNRVQKLARECGIREYVLITYHKELKPAWGKSGTAPLGPYVEQCIQLHQELEAEKRRNGGSIVTPPTGLILPPHLKPGGENGTPQE